MMQIRSVGLGRRKPLIGLDLLHFLNQAIVERGGVCPVMSAPVAVGAQGDDMMNVVRAAIAHPQYVVWLKVRFAVCSQKRGSYSVGLAVAVRASQDVGLHRSATLIGIDDSLSSGRGGLSCGNRGRSQCRQVRIVRGLVAGVDNLFDVFDWAELENDGTPHSASFVRALFIVEALKHIFSLETQVLASLFKGQQAFGPLAVFEDSLVAIGHLHIALATGSEILEHAVSAFSICVAVRTPFWSCDNDHDVVLTRADDAALFLSAKLGVNILFAVIDLPAFKTPRHDVPPSNQLLVGTLGKVAGWEQGAASRPIAASSLLVDQREAAE